MTKLLHIGLGKCGSTFLQREIFPVIAEGLKTNYINLYNNDFLKINKNEIKFHDLEDIKDLEKNLPDKFIISNEDLFSKDWEFSRIYRSFDYIKNNFSNNTVILIVIRNPYDLLSSIYCQTIHEMNIINPENFFYYDKQKKNIRVNNKFNLYNFDYDKIISLYKSYFKKVVVVKYENLQNLNFLKEIYDLNDKFIKQLKINNRIYNKSISKFGINFIIFLNNFFNVQKNQKFIRNLIKPSDRIIYKIKNKILSQFFLRSFFQRKFDRLIPYKKYYIKKHHIPIDIQNEILRYDKLKF